MLYLSTGINKLFRFRHTIDINALGIYFNECKLLRRQILALTNYWN